MEWLVAALLLYPNGNVNVIYNQELYFLDEKSCIEYESGTSLIFSTLNTSCSLFPQPTIKSRKVININIFFITSIIYMLLIGVPTRYERWCGEYS